MSDDGCYTKVVLPQEKPIPKGVKPQDCRMYALGLCGHYTHLRRYLLPNRQIKFNLLECEGVCKDFQGNKEVKSE